jgi:DNA topoisomerase-1
LAAQALAEIGPARNERIARKRIVQAIDVVATRLGNTRAVCRKCYVHPLILDAYAEGRLRGAKRAARRAA